MFRRWPTHALVGTLPPADATLQVEFYFSDSNLPTDKFMWESTGGEENRPMPLKTIANFKRMRQFQPYSAIVAALRESDFLVVEGAEGEETVRRKTPYVSSTEAQKARLAASVYAKGFGDEEPSTQFDIEAFFSNYGHVKHVKLRRTAEELFKGSVFVEFASAEEADAFVKLDPKPTWKGHELIIMKKKDYLDEKTRQIKAGEIEPNTSRPRSFFEGKERGSKVHGRGGRGGGRGRDGKSDGGENNNAQKNGSNKNGRGRGKGGRGGRNGGRYNNNNNNNNREEKKTEGTKQSTNEYVSALTSAHSLKKLCAEYPCFSLKLLTLSSSTVSKCPPSSLLPRRTEKLTASGRARMTTLARSPRPRRSTASRKLLRHNTGTVFYFLVWTSIAGWERKKIPF